MQRDRIYSTINILVASLQVKKLSLVVSNNTFRELEDELKFNMNSFIFKGDEIEIKIKISNCIVSIKEDGQEI